MRPMIVMTLLVAPVAAQDSRLSVGPLRPQPGQTVWAMVAAPPGRDGTAEVPISVIRGVRPGPVLALIAGNHGYEYTPILALQKALTAIDAKQLAGSLILVHVANMPSFLGRTIYFSPVDGKNLNRVYPGKRDGTQSERIAWLITTEVIEKADYVLDLHCGDGNESLRPYLYQAVTGDKAMDERIAALALSFGMDHIVLDRNRPKDPAQSLYCSTTAITRGKPALTIESGFLGVSDAGSVEAILRGVRGTMGHLKMMETAAAPAVRPVYYEPSEVIASPATGILYWHVERDQQVAKGALVAHVTDFFGKKIGEMRAPFDGLVLYIVATPPISKGQPVAFIGATRK